jgi:hypothetical protein
MFSTNQVVMETQNYRPHEHNGYAVYPGKFGHDYEILQSVDRYSDNISSLCLYSLTEAQFDHCLAPTFSSWHFTRLTLNSLDLPTVEKIMLGFSPLNLISIGLTSLSDNCVNYIYDHLYGLCQVSGHTFKVTCNSQTISSIWQSKFDKLMLSQMPAPRVAYIEATLKLREDEKASLQTELYSQHHEIASLRAQLYTQQQLNIKGQNSLQAVLQAQKLDHTDVMAAKDKLHEEEISDFNNELIRVSKKKSKYKRRASALAYESETEAEDDKAKKSMSEYAALAEYEDMLLSAKEKEYDLHDKISQLETELKDSQVMRANDQTAAVNQVITLAGIFRAAKVEKKRRALLDSSSRFFPIIRLRRCKPEQVKSEQIKSEQIKKTYEIVQTRRYG